MNRADLLKAAVVMFGMYFLINYIKGAFFPSRLIIWVVIYFVVAYMKLYMKDFSANTKINLILLFVGIAGNIGMITLMNILELRMGYPSGMLLHWDNECSPFSVLIAISLLNLAMNTTWRNSLVNSISSLTLLIYIIHENIIIRSYVRPYMLEWMYLHLGYKYILLWVVICAVGIFIISALLSMLWRSSMRKPVKMGSEMLHAAARYLYRKIIVRATAAMK
ncbi:MAG: hypothetical protein LUC22_02905 [Prevotella sp.]|nr:hypothetical protein [Prevotella sp.]